MTDKGVNSQKLRLIESNQILSADIDVAETFNSFFTDAPKSLSINENSYIINDTLGITDPIDIALKKFESHHSILKIKENVSGTRFSFHTITLEEVELEIRNLNPNKASAYNNIPVRNRKQNLG